MGTASGACRINFLYWLDDRIAEIVAPIHLPRHENAPTDPGRVTTRDRSTLLACDASLIQPPLRGLPILGTEQRPPVWVNHSPFDGQVGTARGHKTLEPSWNPSEDGTIRVHVLIADAARGRVGAGGAFTSIGGTGRYWFAIFG